MAKGGQRFIGENRKPRVHIEYEVDTYGSRQKVELPFVVGVMSDLSGKSEVAKKPLKEGPDGRAFLEFDMDNFETRMEAIAPSVSFQVKDTLTGAGQRNFKMTFNSLDDFSPGAVAKADGPLAKLLEAREQLNDLMIYMDGKDGAQELLDKVLKDPELLKALAATRASGGEGPKQG